MWPKFSPILLGLSITLLTACGGGSDSSAEVTEPTPVDPTIPTQPDKSNVELAIENEDHNLATSQEIIDFALAQTAHIDESKFALLNEFYQDINALSWFPSHDSTYFTSNLPAHTFSVLTSTHHNNGTKAQVGLVMAGEQNQHRYAAMGANLMAVDVSDETVLFTKQLFAWLTNDDSKKSEINLITSHVPSKADSRYFQHNEKMRSWLDANYPDSYQVNEAHSCDGEALITCLQTQAPDVLILSDTDREDRGFDVINEAIEYAKSQNIPILVSNYRRGPSSFMAPMYKYMGISGANNYWSKYHANSLTQADLMHSDFIDVNHLLSQLASGKFDNSTLAACTENFINCTTPEFEQSFKSGADWFKQSSESLDSYGINPFQHGKWNLLKAGLLLADKYRSEIDYPIDFADSALWQQAMFADWVISYKRENNLAQPDLGEYVIPANQLALNNNAHYAYVETIEDRQQISVPYTGQWTTTGWYVQPGHKITLTRHDNSDALVKIKLNYHRPNTNRAFKHHVYRGPLALNQQRISLPAGESVTFSSPYGGPLYFHISGEETSLTIDVSAKNVAQHATITNFNSEEQIARFNQTLNETQLPHVDLKTFGAEQHMRRDKFLGALGEKYPTVTDLLTAVQEDHINAVYTLAGFKIDGKSLAQSLPNEVQAICAAMSSTADCLNEAFHTRTRIQHANYDQHAHCGGGCSGNPWDSSGNISPSGWLDNHELGHNLQTKRLNVHYVESAQRNNWSAYSNRSGENSNNIFPYYVKWNSHYNSQQNTSAITDGHTNHKDTFNVFMSDASMLTNEQGERVVYDRKCNAMPDGESRFVAPWKSNEYAAHNSFRMSFYIQMAFHFDKQNLQGVLLSNGFNIYTLLYQHNRIFGQYAKDEASWLAMRNQLGFSEFAFANDDTYAGNTVSNIPGNDFMVVTLSKLAGQDWRPYFDMYGLHYSDLAQRQIAAANYTTKVNMGMFEIETELPDQNISLELDYLPLSLSDASTTWRDGSSPSDCQ